LTLVRAIAKLPAQRVHFLPARRCDTRKGGCMKILIADDNRDAAQSLGTLLELSNHEVLIAHDGEEALRIARRAMPDAMILDIGMPRITGDQVARALRSEPWGGKVLMIAVTGWGEPQDKASAAAAGFDHHLTKPIDIDAIEKLLGEFVPPP
jgi:CheY-like chemotaxis protein